MNRLIATAISTAPATAVASLLQRLCSTLSYIKRLSPFDYTTNIIHSAFNRTRIICSLAEKSRGFVKFTEKVQRLYRSVRKRRSTARLSVRVTVDLFTPSARAISTFLMPDE